VWCIKLYIYRFSGIHPFRYYKTKSLHFSSHIFWLVNMLLTHIIIFHMVHFYHNVTLPSMMRHALADPGWGREGTRRPLTHPVRSNPEPATAMLQSTYISLVLWCIKHTVMLKNVLHFCPKAVSVYNLKLHGIISHIVMQIIMLLFSLNTSVVYFLRFFCLLCWTGCGLFGVQLYVTFYCSVIILNLERVHNARYQNNWT